MTSDIQPYQQTIDITLVRLTDLIETYKNDDLQVLLDSFQCSINNDVQTFLHKNAILIENSDKGRTYLVVTTSSYENPKSELDIVGYFTIALKHVLLHNEISNTKKKKIHGLSVPDENPLIVVGYLIGQLAKNDNALEHIPGSIILKAALGQIEQIKNDIGGRFVLVECERQPKLINFYKNSNFEYLQDDPADNMAQLFYFL